MYNKTKFCAHWFKNYKWLLIFKIKYMIDWVRLEFYCMFIIFNTISIEKIKICKKNYNTELFVNEDSLFNS